MERWMEVMNDCVEILDAQSIVYQLAGGTAARFYGSLRPIWDLDFEMQDEDLEKVAKSLVARGAKMVRVLSPYADEEWQLNLVTLEWRGQLIDLAGVNFARILDKETQRWENLPNDPKRARWRRFGRELVRIIPREDLVRYKKMLGRPVDILDLEYLGESKSQVKIELGLAKADTNPEWLKELVSQIAG